MSDRFDELVHGLIERKSPEAVDALWGAVFRLEEWIFIGVGVSPRYEPVMAETDGRMFLLAFTDKDRAHAYAKEHTIRDASGATPVMSVGVAAIEQFLAKYTAQGAFGLLFNPGPGAFFLPMGSLPSMLKRHREGQQEEALSAFDALVEAARLAGTEEASEAMWKSLFEQDAWRFVAQGRESETPTYMMMADKACIMAFTDVNKAHSWAKRQGMLNDDGSANLLEVDVASASKWLGGLDPSMYSGAVFNDGVNGFFLPVAKIRSLRKQYSMGG
ncbi:MAG: hypothetical protein VYC34_01990 [Planctomycetota bacterium]|nr:hypothetical protein [Planctomycetota bacterium]